MTDEQKALLNRRRIDNDDKFICQTGKSEHGLWIGYQCTPTLEEAIVLAYYTSLKKA